MYRGLPADQPDYMQRVKLLASNWYQRLVIKPLGSTPTNFATVALPGVRKSRMDW